ncbi:MAG: hypothetical protein ACK4VN_02020 [Bacteroidales bacterium]
MEDYIYIILGIVWLVISILGGKKKKQQQQQQQQQQQNKPKAEPTESIPQQSFEPPVNETESDTDIEVLLEEFFGAGNKQQSTPAPQATPRPFAQMEEEKPLQPYVTETFADEISRELRGRYESLEQVEQDYEFSAEGKIETIDDLIKSYDHQHWKAEEENSQISVVELDGSQPAMKDFRFDARQAIIYAEIINRKYF